MDDPYPVQQQENTEQTNFGANQQIFWKIAILRKLLQIPRKTPMTESIWYHQRHCTEKFAHIF